jgi:hypothetical protein
LASFASLVTLGSLNSLITKEYLPCIVMEMCLELFIKCSQDGACPKSGPVPRAGLSQERACPKSGQGLSQERACPKNAKQYSFSKHSFSSQSTQMQRFDLIPLIVREHARAVSPIIFCAVEVQLALCTIEQAERHLRLYKIKVGSKGTPRAAVKSATRSATSVPQGQPTNVVSKSASQAAKSAFRSLL